MNELVKLEGGKPVVSSRDLADSFDKPHKHILESARKLIRDLESDGHNFGHENFQEATYQTDRGKTYSNILMTRDGFTLVAMGLSGKKAVNWKIKYMEAFKKMEGYITKESDDLTTRINGVSKEIDCIKEAGSVWGKSGAAIRKKKRKAISELEVLIDQAQMKLNF